MTEVDADRSRGKISLLGVLPFLLAVVAFPVLKVHVFQHVAAVDRFRATGVGPGRWIFGGLYIGSELVLAAMCVLVVRWEGRPLSEIGLTSPSRRWWLALAAVVGLCAAIVALRHVGVIDIPKLSPGAERDAVLSATNTGQRVVTLVSAVIAVACEEIVWRGYAVRRLQTSGVRTWIAVIVPSAAFGYFHGGTVGTIAISVAVGVAAVGLCWLFLRTRSLAMPYLLHVGWTLLFISLAPGV